LTGAQLNAMTIEQLKNNKIQRILYGGNTSLGRLTFLFPSNIRSPPVFSYHEEPDKYSIAMGGASISSIGFGITTHATEPIYFLSTIVVLDDKHKLLTELAAGSGAVSRIDEVKLTRTQLVVGAQV